MADLPSLLRLAATGRAEARPTQSPAGCAEAPGRELDPRRRPFARRRPRGSLPGRGQPETQALDRQWDPSAELVTFALLDRADRQRSAEGRRDCVMPTGPLSPSAASKADARLGR